MAVMTYLYRDASNYKQLNAVRLTGDLPTQEELKIIEEALDLGEYFIPEQFGLPILRPGELNCDDHCWCELDPYSDFMTDDEAKHSGLDIQDTDLSVSDIVQMFREIAEGADCWHETDYAVIFVEEE